MSTGEGLSPWQRVDRLARRQHQAVTRSQVREAGVCDRVLTERVREQGWGRPYRGVLVLPGAPDTYELRCSAALLSVGEPAAITGVGALHLQGIVASRPAVVPVAVPGHRFLSRRTGVEIIRMDRFEDMPGRFVARLRTASPAWAFADLPRHAAYDDIGRALVSALRTRKVTLDEVTSVADVRGNVQHVGLLRRAVADLRGELSHSRDESTGRRLLRAAGLPVHPRPYTVEHDGSPVAEIDLAMPSALYGVEVDGLHHLLPEQNRADKARDRLLARLGWTIDRFTVEDIRRSPEAFVRHAVARYAALRRITSGSLRIG